MTRLLAAPTMPRRLRAAALLPVAALALAGCQWTSPVQTDHAYEPADGRTVHMGQVSVNNVLLVTDKAGGDGTLVGRISNDSDAPVKVSLQVPQSQPAVFEVPAHQSTQLSEPEGKGKQTSVRNVPVRPGGLIDVAINTSLGDAQSLRIPVLAPYPPYGSYSTVTPPAPAPEPTATHSEGEGTGH